MDISYEGPSIFWSYLLIDELVKNGLYYFCVSPGYRNAPLIYALQLHSKVIVKSCFDERAAGHVALGIGHSTRRPAILLCTSGTALAHYLPALLEAKYSRVPMIVLSADRPQEMVGSDVNQTMDQTRILQSVVDHSLFFPTPTADTNPCPWLGHLNLRLYKQQQDPLLHLNVPLAPPLTPQVKNLSRPSGKLYAEGIKILHKEEPWQGYQSSLSLPPLSSWQGPKAKKILFVVGRLSWTEAKILYTLIPQVLSHLLQQKKSLLIYVDSSSHLVALHYQHPQLPFLIFDWDHPQSKKALNDFQPEQILHWGGPLISKNFSEYVAKNSELIYERFSSHIDYQDGSLGHHQRYAGPLECFLHACLTETQSHFVPASFSSLPLSTFFQQRKSDHLSFLQTMVTIARFQDPESFLFLGNSLSVRVFEQVRSEFKHFVPCYMNRGLSGIEGHLATAIGHLLGSSFSRGTLLLGDISFLHDLNSLHLLRDTPGQLTLILFNNQSGGLFHHLPLKQHPSLLDPLIGTPHELTFGSIVRGFGLDYDIVQKNEELESLLQQPKARHRVIEVLLNLQIDEETFSWFETITPSCHF